MHTLPLILLVRGVSPHAHTHIDPASEGRVAHMHTHIDPTSEGRVAHMHTLTLILLVRVV